MGTFTKRPMRLFSWLAVLSAAQGAFGASAYPRVVLSPDASPVETFAASELSTYLDAMSKSLEVSPLAADAGTIAVGYGAALELGIATSALQGLGNDSFLISSNHSGIPRGSWVGSGGQHSARGTLFAVYELLRVLGCEFLAHDFSIAEELPTIPPTALPQIDRTYQPLYEYRDNNEYVATRYSRWAGKLGYNGASAHANTSVVPNAGKTYAGFVHTGYALLGSPDGRSAPPELWKEHREWFWPRAANDSQVYGQLCWSNASLVTFMIERVRMKLRSNPNANIISVSQMDNGLYCQSAEEMEIIKEEGTPGGALFRAVNTIADAIKQEFPNVAVDTLAYQWSRPAPALTKPKPNVIIRLCSIECNFAAPMTDPSNLAFQTDMDKWAAISNRTYIWNYVTSFGSYLQPFPNWYVIGPNIQYFAQHGVRGIFEEGSYNTPGGDMQVLKAFVMGRMLWDNSLAPESLITQFLSGYFGEAAPFIRLYMDTFHGTIANTNFYMHENVPVTAAYITPIATLTSAQAFKQALAVTANDPAKQGRVHVAKMSIYYVLLLRWDEMKSFATANSIPWAVEHTKQLAWNEFALMWKRIGILSEREGSCDINCFHAQVFSSGIATPMVANSTVPRCLSGEAAPPQGCTCGVSGSPVSVETCHFGQVCYLGQGEGVC